MAIRRIRPLPLGPVPPMSITYTTYSTSHLQRSACIRATRWEHVRTVYVCTRIVTPYVYGLNIRVLKVRLYVRTHTCNRARADMCA